MAIARQYAVTVGTSAVALPGTQYKGWILRNNSASIIYLGDADVTTSTGFPIDPGAIFSPAQIAHESLSTVVGQVSEIRLYAIAGGAGNDVRVFLPGRV